VADKVQKRAIDGIRPVSAPNRLIREAFSGGSGEAEGVTVRIVDLEPVSQQGVRRPHWHDGFEEVIYILAGQGRLWADGAWFDVAAGDTLLIPAGVIHATFNGTEKPLRLLCFFPVAEGVDARLRSDLEIRLEESDG
jgi:quercetin dioxygenase-like cupin family protein